ncbi:hypothetical protein JW964_07245 [candidate division KSB1 bacterium]|nr:hypothetical protein [candidate division KSB1 bacterium]
MRNWIFPGKISFIMLLSLIFIQVNIFYNQHIHQLENGIFIIHAHPFQRTGSDAPVKHHQHDRLELLYYAQIVHLYEQSLIIAIVWIIFLAVMIFHLVRFLCIRFNQFIFIPPGRAPPGQRCIAKFY